MSNYFNIFLNFKIIYYIYKKIDDKLNLCFMEDSLFFKNSSSFDFLIFPSISFCILSNIVS